MGLEHANHVGVLFAGQEFDQAVLQRLEARSRAKQVAEFQVFARRERFQHAPLLEQLALHHLHAREDLLHRPELVALEVGDRRTQFMDHQLQPKLRDLVLDDEQHLVVVHGPADRLLRGEQEVQAQVTAVALALRQVRDHAFFDRALVGKIGIHGGREGPGGRPQG